MKRISVIIIAAGLLLAGCRSAKTITVEVPVPVHDTMYQTKEVHDSVYVENTVKEYVKGDTVFSEKTRIKYIERIQTDTVRQTVEVPVEIIKTIEKTVEKPLTWMQKTLMIMGGGFFLIVLGFGLVFYFWITDKKEKK